MYRGAIKRGVKTLHYIIIKSSLFEGIFTDAKGVNCATLETVHAKKYFL